MLREVRKLGDAATTVLGNHDFHLLTIAAGHRRPHRERHARRHPRSARPRRADRVARRRGRWSSSRSERLLVHAGLLPQWTAATALMLSREVQAMLGGERAHEFLGVLYGDEPRQWRDDLAGLRSAPRRRQRLHATALLHCRRHDGLPRKARRRRTRPKASCRGSRNPARQSARMTVVCGHWSTLDLVLAPNVLMLDSGCLWGGTLTGCPPR